MAKRIHSSPTPLDAQVAAMITRIGAGSPLSHMTGYTVERLIGEVHTVTIRFIADGEFDAPAAQAGS